MDSQTTSALKDLLTVRALSEIRPSQVQAWQAAARDLLAGVEVPDAVPSPPARAPVIAVATRPSPENDNA